MRGDGDAAKKIFARLLGFCCALDSWIAIDIPIEDGMPTPEYLRGYALEVIVELLRQLGGSVTTVKKSDTPTWKVLKDILGDCLQVVQGRQLAHSFYLFRIILMIFRIYIFTWPIRCPIHGRALQQTSDSSSQHR